MPMGGEGKQDMAMAATVESIVADDQASTPEVAAQRPAAAVDETG